MAINEQVSKALSDLFKDGMKGTGQSEEGMLFVAKNLMPLLAKPMVQQMGVGGSPVTMLDSACGAGVATDVARKLLAEGNALEGSRFVAADNSDKLVEIVKRRIEEEGWTNTEAKVLDAMDTKLPDNTFTHVAIALGLHLIPRPDDVVKDAIRILMPGGAIGFTTFQEGSAHEFWRADVESAFASFPFEAPFPGKFPLQMHSSGNWVDRKAVEEHLTSTYSDQLVDIQVKNIVGRHTFHQPEEFIVAFGTMLGWITSAWWSEELRQAHPIEEIKELIVKHLKEKYGGQPWEVSWETVCGTARLRE